MRQLAREDAIAHSVWLLLSLLAAVRRPGFAEELANLGIRAAPTTSALAFIVEAADRLDALLGARPPAGHFSEMGTLAFRHALASALTHEGPSLFDSGLDDVQRVLHAWATDRQFARLAADFFGCFLSRALRSFVDRELDQYIGATHAYASVVDGLTFMNALDHHAYHAATIVEEFAQGWFSLHVRRSDYTVAFDEVHGFVAHLLPKLAETLRQQARPAQAVPP